MSEMEELLTIARKFAVPRLQITSAKRLAMKGFKEEFRQEILNSINTLFPHESVGKPGYIMACQGRPDCRHGCATTAELSAGVEAIMQHLVLPAKVKIGISACPRNCCAGYTKDMGLFANMTGWVLTFGGNAGSRPRIADLVADGLTGPDALTLAERCLGYYSEHALARERTARFIERIGIHILKKALLSHSKRKQAQVAQDVPPP